MSFRRDSSVRGNAPLGEEAAEWLLRLDDTDPDRQDEYSNERARDQAFLEWLKTSPEHLRVFLETVETHRRMRLIDARLLINVETLLMQRADVIPLPNGWFQRETHHPEAAAREKERPLSPPAVTAGVNGKRVPLRGIAAAVLACVLGAGGYWWSAEQSVYTTKIGEQRSTKLEDGSFIYLNTDSNIEVDFSDKARNIRLVRGEALFVVERDSSRPFTVTAGNATVRALGTQFNVRRRAEGAEVAVVEGTVQVTAMDERAGFPAQTLVAGEEVQVGEGKIVPRSRSAVAEALAWRQRRLVFHDARLVDVAAEFNRYNRTKIRIEGGSARDMQLSGTFDADRPQALMLYAAKSDELTVEPQGNDWVIRGR